MQVVVIDDFAFLAEVLRAILHEEASRRGVQMESRSYPGLQAVQNDADYVQRSDLIVLDLWHGNAKDYTTKDGENVLEWLKGRRVNVGQKVVIYSAYADLAKLDDLRRRFGVVHGQLKMANIEPFLHLISKMLGWV